MKIRIILVFIFIISILTLSNSCEEEKNSGRPADGDGNFYDTITIGTQTWFKKNLKSTSYRNGDPVRLITDNEEWVRWQQGAYCWYNNNILNKDIYGALYNWYSAHTQALCPVAGMYLP